MADPLVRETGRIEDMDGGVLIVGVDYDTVTIARAGFDPFRLESSQADEFGALFISACWQAARQAGETSG
jgi:hypothetical protein